MEKTFDKYAKIIGFHINSGFIDPDNSLNVSWSHAVTWNNPVENGRVWIPLSLELIEPFFYESLSEAERMICHFELALTLIHATAARFPISTCSLILIYIC